MLAIITGASSGIGLETAKIFLEKKFKVLNLSRRPCPLAGVDNLSIDLKRSDFVQEVLKFMGSGKGKKIIHLIHNASTLQKDEISSLSAENLRLVLEINVVAPQTLNRALVPIMEARSSIIYVGSTLASKAVAHAASYTISKHAQLGLMRATCQDLSGTGIHTVMVSPGFTDTEMLRAHVGSDAEILSVLAKRQAMGRLIRPNEIAGVIWECTQNQVLNGANVDANLGQIES